jgi:hypothetical protein
VSNVARLVDDSELAQASSIMLPMAMLGDVDAVVRGLEAYRPGLRLVDRARSWDPIDLVPALTAVMLERWDLIEEPVQRLEYCAARGSRLASAGLEAIAEERSGSAEPTEVRHHALRELGYDGISDLLTYRASV